MLFSRFLVRAHALAFLIVLGVATATARVVTFKESSPVNVDCFQKLLVAMPLLIGADAEMQKLVDGRESLRYLIPAHNDIMCSPPELMMNAVVVVADKKTGGQWYGIFHIHIGIDGTFKSATTHNKPRWVKFQTPQEWRVAWCDHISSFYPEDHKAQCSSP